MLEKDAATAVWYRIRFSDSITGWVQATCVRLHGDGRNLPVAGTRPVPVGPQLNLKSSVTSGLDLRTGPGTTHRILLTLPPGPPATGSWARTPTRPPGTKSATARVSPAGCPCPTCRPTAVWRA